MRRFAAVIFASTFFVSSAYAAGNASNVALAPGKPAGVKAAQLENQSTLLVVAGLGIVAAGIALSASGDSNAITNATTTTTSTSTTSTTRTTSSTTTTG